MNQAILIEALNYYLTSVQIEPMGNITSKIATINTCLDRIEKIDNISADWAKLNWTVLAPAIRVYHKYLKAEIDHATLTCDQKSLLKSRREYADLSPYIELFKQFKKF